MRTPPHAKPASPKSKRPTAAKKTTAAKKKAPAAKKAAKPMPGPSPATVVDWSKRGLSGALRAAAARGGGLGALLTLAADAHDQHALRKASSLHALVGLAAGLLVAGHPADALEVARRVQVPSTRRVSQSAGVRSRAGALEVLALRALGDNAGAARVDKALGHSTFGFARNSPDDVRIWNKTADEEEGEWAALGPLGAPGAVPAACAHYASCAAHERDATSAARARLRALREDVITPALRGALAG